MAHRSFQHLIHAVYDEGVKVIHYIVLGLQFRLSFPPT
jgi:hypothetical protein